ncbi:HD domain-containing protein [Pisolithus marmoratus]|nr:HD domain-containing protein [Pisolithus marmoratus]
MAEQSSSGKRVFPPLYVSTGDVDTDRLAFFHVLERLKIPNPESIADHMCRMAILAMCTSDASLDIPKCVLMCIVHDLAEAQVGDITPSEGISKEEKRQLEAEAMHNFVHDMLHRSEAALKIEALWKEYEEQQTKEARFVKDLDRLEMALQAREYEKAHCRYLQDFFDSSLPLLRHEEVRGWGEALDRERRGA